MWLVFTDTLPLGSYCSFETGSCGWTVSGTQSSWNLVSGEQLSRNTDLLGKTLQNTQGEYIDVEVSCSIFYIYFFCICELIILYYMEQNDNIHN